MSFDPAPRPALRRASDGSAHPTAPATPATPATPTTPASPASPTAPTLGGATSDVLRPAKPEKTAKLKVQVPRSLRAALEAQAKAEGVSLDALVSRILGSR